MKEKDGEHPWGDAGQVVLLVVFLGVWALDSFLLRWSTGLAEAVPFRARLGLAIVLVVLAFHLIKAGHGVASRASTAEGLLTTGIYRYLRHPIYLGCLLAYLALALSTLSVGSLAVWAGGCMFYNTVAGYEEMLLRARFGDEYREYRQRTGKWVPRSTETAVAPPWMPRTRNHR